ncbi:hypothetical protein FKM82_023395 [Ascaphus truei]
MGENQEQLYIVGGDFNMVPDPDKSTHPGHSHSAMTYSVAKKFRLLMREFGLLDARRCSHEGQRDYSFYSLPHDSNSRIDDNIFVSPNILEVLVHSYI